MINIINFEAWWKIRFSVYAFFKEDNAEAYYSTGK